MTKGNNSRRETKLEVDDYILNLKDALKKNHFKLTFQRNRFVDDQRDEEFTNRYTVSNLFPNDDPVDVLKKELLELETENYIETVKDSKYPTKSEMRVFGKMYDKDVYIKIRVDLQQSSTSGDHDLIFVMSFHYAEHPFTNCDFPYRKK